MQKIKKKNEQEAPALRTLIISDKRNLYSKQFRMFREDSHVIMLHRIKQTSTRLHTGFYFP